MNPKDVLKAAKKLLKIEADFQAQLEKLGYDNHTSAMSAMAFFAAKHQLELLVQMLEQGQGPADE